MSRILITGASGLLGATVIDQLIKNKMSNEIVAFVRDPKKADSLIAKNIEVRFGDYENKNTIDAAVKGINKILLISSPSSYNRFPHHKNVIDAILDAGIDHIVFTSISLKNPDTSSNKNLITPLLQTEEYLKESGIFYTVLRNTLYAESISGFIDGASFETGIHLPTGNGRVPFALRSEMGEATANVLLNDAHKNKTYDFTGTKSYSFQDIADTLSSLTRKTVNYYDIDSVAHAENLRKIGIPEHYISIITEFAADIKNQQYDIESNDLENILGRKPSNIEEIIKKLYNL